MKPLTVFGVVVTFAALVVLASVLHGKTTAGRDVIDALASDVESLKRQAAAAAVKFDVLKAYVMTPRFARHQDRCEQCSPDCEGEEGPCPLCEEGFELLQQDLREGGRL